MVLHRTFNWLWNGLSLILMPLYELYKQIGEGKWKTFGCECLLLKSWRHMCIAGCKIFEKYREYMKNLEYFTVDPKLNWN